MSRVRTHLLATSLSLIALCAPLYEVWAQPTIAATLASSVQPQGEAMHVTIRTQEGLERFVFQPKTSISDTTHETHYQGFARPRNFQREKLASSMTVTESRAWVFFTSRRTGRPVAATITLQPEGSHLIAKRIRVSRVPKQKIGCGSHAGDDDHTPSTADAVSSRRVNRSANSPLTAQGQKAFSPARILEVATEADFEFFQVHGDQSNTYIRAVLNAVDAIYTSNLGIRLKVISQRVDTTPPGGGGAISATSLLEDFRTSSFASASPADVRHLFTGRTIEGLTIGIAYVGAVCTAGGRYGVGLSSAVSAGLQPFLAAHEIAHNLSATHDNEPQSIMNPAITEENNRFTSQSLSNIYSFVSTTGSCLATQDLSDVRVQLDPTDPTKFSARVSFATTQPQACSILLYGSADGRRFIPLASSTQTSKGLGTEEVATFVANTPRLSSQQTFYFKAKVSCGTSRTISAPTRLRYGYATSGTGKTRGSTRWLEALKRNLTS
jgi:hypothetical protein